MTTATDVALFVSSMDGGGAHKMMVQIASGLSKLNYEVDIVLLKERGPLYGTIPDGVNIIPLRADRALTCVPCLVPYLIRRKPSALLASPVSVTLPAIWASMLAPVDTRLVLRVPTFMSKNQFYTDPNSLSDHIKARLISTFYPQADRLIAISQGVANDLVKSFGIPPEDIRVIYNPAINDEVESKCTEEATHPFFEDSMPVIMGAGRLTPAKDFKTLIDAFEKLLEGHDARLLILGEGEKRADLESQVTQKNLNDKVSLPGFINNPFPFMRAADVFVLSSSWEGFGNVIPEAMACGTSIVATDCESGPREILKDGEFGELVQVGDADSMSRAIARMLEHPTNHEKLKSRSRDFHVDEIIPVYESVLLG